MGVRKTNDWVAQLSSAPCDIAHLGRVGSTRSTIDITIHVRPFLAESMTLFRENGLDMCDSALAPYRHPGPGIFDHDRSEASEPDFKAARDQTRPCSTQICHMTGWGGVRKVHREELWSNSEGADPYLR